MARKAFITTGAEYGCMADGGAGLDKEIKEFIENLEGGNPNGVFCTPVDEPVPTHEKAACEIVYPGLLSPHNTWIVLGRDRPHSLASGAGGRGRTQSGMIDIVVGKGHIHSAAKLQGNKGACQPYPGYKEVHGPNFVNDAARIYITQQTLGGDDTGDEGGIDSYLGLPWSPEIESGLKSAIAIKSDHTRIVGREAVRIYAGSALNVENPPGTGKGEKNCAGTKLEKPRIELVAGGSDDIQPMVLGNNLKSHLEDVAEMMHNVVDSIRELYKMIGHICVLLSILTLGIGPFISFSLKSLVGYIDQWLQSFNIIADEVNSLDKLLLKGHNSVLSNTCFAT